VADPDRLYPKQPLDSAIQRGLQRPKDSPMRQKVRMGDNPEERQKEDFSIRLAQKSGRKYSRGPTVGDVIGDEAAYRRPMSRRQRRSSRS
jgi:hypothetical protein